MVGSKIVDTEGVSGQDSTVDVVGVGPRVTVTQDTLFQCR